MAFQHYYAVRVYDDNGKPLSTRVEQANGPRRACQLAFGVIYDNDYDTAKYCDLGTRKPTYLSHKKRNELMAEPNWKKIPKTGE